MRNSYLLPLAAALILTVAGPGIPSAAPQDCYHPCASGAVEPGSEGPNSGTPMLPMDAEAVRKAFNASSDKVRIVALLSPTCPGCRSGHGVVGQVLKKFSSPKLQAILVWEPMREGGTPVAATQQAGAVQDARITQGWNENRIVGKFFGETLDLHDVAWDVYLVYKPGIKWESQQPPPPHSGCINSKAPISICCCAKAPLD